MRWRARVMGCRAPRSSPRPGPPFIGAVGRPHPVRQPAAGAVALAVVARLDVDVQAQRLVAAYGSRLVLVMGDAKSRSDLGPAFGPELTAAEARYLMAREWARFPDDILWRRSKLGLTMQAQDRAALAAFMAAGCEVAPR